LLFTTEHLGNLTMGGLLNFRLIWCSCSSAREFASGFLQTNPRG